MFKGFATFLKILTFFPVNMLVNESGRSVQTIYSFTTTSPVEFTTHSVFNLERNKLYYNFVVRTPDGPSHSFTAVKCTTRAQYSPYLQMRKRLNWFKLTCDQALFSFRSVKHSGGTGETENRAWYNSSTERLPPTFLIDWHATKQPIKISSACTILGMQISHNGNSEKVT